MTAQISDTLGYLDHDYSIIAIEKDWPFHPEAHGFRPKMMSTACMRGFYCRYQVSENQLLLTQMNIRVEGEPIPTWRGATVNKNPVFTAWEYQGVDLPLAYSGGIVMGREFLREFYVHMGFHRPHCYQYVVELVFQDGFVIKATDHSERMERVRKSMKTKEKYRGTSENFIEEAFSLSYAKKWPY